MKFSQRASRLALVVAVLALMSTPALAAEEPIEMEIGPDLVEWFPNTEWKLGHLIITGPDCLHLQFQFDREDRIVFKPYDVEGNALPDGFYSYDLRLGPGAEVRGLNEEYGTGQLCRGRRNLPSLEALTTTGYVSIIEKRFVDPFKEEDNPRVAEDGLEGAGSEGGEPIALGSPGMVLAGGELMDDPPQSMSAATVISGDLTVYNSICVGFDCPTNPTFNADTIRLQENNLRIHFDDTSTASGFPNRDWRIVANDQASGGASKFSVQDATANRTPFTIEGNSPSNALYVDNGGRIGINTSTPVTEIHIRDGDTPTLRLEQDTSSGFAAQTWDVAGNETSFFIRDATNGSTLPFRIQPGASSNTVFIDNNSEVGIGTTSPSQKLHVRGTSGTTAALVEEASGSAALRTLFTIRNNGGTRMQFDDTSVPRIWNFQTAGNNFVIDSDQSGGVVDMRLVGNASGGNLEVAGTISSGGMVLNVPDFVFEPEYTLMPMEDLRAFIVENRHLPEVPNAEEIKENGLNHGDFQMRLLRKIEELTLYTLEQQETIEALMSEVRELQETAAD